MNPLKCTLCGRSATALFLPMMAIVPLSLYTKRFQRFPCDHRFEIFSQQSGLLNRNLCELGMTIRISRFMCLQTGISNGIYIFQSDYFVERISQQSFTGAITVLREFPEIQQQLHQRSRSDFWFQ